MPTKEEIAQYLLSSAPGVTPEEAEKAITNVKSANIPEVFRQAVKGTYKKLVTDRLDALKYGSVRGPETYTDEEFYAQYGSTREEMGTEAVEERRVYLGSATKQ